MQRTKSILYFIGVFTFLLFQKSFSQKDSTRNIAVMAGCSILEGNGIRVELPSFYYGSRKHAISIAPIGKFGSDNSFAPGISIGYFYFIEPSFRDITFYLTYNTAFFFEKNYPITHIIGIGTQIDIGKRAFIQHSVGFGLQQSVIDLSSLGSAGQLKLSIGIYIREIPVQHIHDDWEGH